MKHLDIQESLGVFALDAVDEDERRIIEAHIAECDECRDEVAAHREVVSKLAATERWAPPGLWDDISPQLIPPTGDLDRPATPTDLAEVVPLRRSWLRIAAVAAAMVLVGSAAVVQTVRLDRASDELQVAEAAAAEAEASAARPALDQVALSAVGDPGAQLVSLEASSSSAKAIIVLMPDGTGYVTQHTLEPLPADRTYQLWAIVDGRVISAGVLGSDPGTTPFHIDVEGFEGFAITEEIAGGVVSSANDPVVAWLSA
jgi:anti-sigma-K factor RskA